MASDGETRRLAAIMASDVVGYSRLMGSDEAGTLSAIRSLRKEVWGPKIDEYGGRVVKTTGDGQLTEFPSVADAVQCAVEMQRAMRRRNADIPEDHRIVLRVGINQGDIIVDGDDIYGDGVNVAARLEEIAEPGGICISRKVRDEIRDKLLYDLDDLGEQEVKNIARPVRVFRVSIEETGVAPGAATSAPPARPPIAATPAQPSARSPWLIPAAVAAVVVIAVVAVAAWQGDWFAGTTQTATIPDDAAEDTNALSLPDRPSIAVLAFDNLSGEPDQEYFSDAISESIITALAQVPNMFVIARNSSFHYKGTATGVIQIAEELGVRYVLEGSVQRQGDRVRVIAQLIDGRTDAHLWQETFDREVSDLFALQDDITRKVVTDIAIEIKYASYMRGTRNMEAYDLGLRARMNFLRGNEADNALAVALALRAIELDPEYSRAYAYLAWARSGAATRGWNEGPENTPQRAVELARKAVELDDTDFYSHWTLARMVQLQGDFDEAEAEYQKALALNPNNPDIRVFMSFARALQGHHDEAVQAILTAMRVNPFYPAWYAASLGVSYYNAKDYEKAIAAFADASSLNPTASFSHLWMAMSYAQLGQQEKAEAEAEIALQMNPKFTINRFLVTGFRAQYEEEAVRDHMRGGLLKAGFPEGPQATN